jgi:succinate dehydrogenase hydrophobic anchor subunit
VTPEVRSRHFAAGIPVLSFVLLAVGAFSIFAASTLFEGVGISVFTDPVGWLSRFDHDSEAGILLSASQVMAGLLAIAITVSAIIVELAATRYNYRITLLFIREPINIAAMSLFVVTTLQCVWVGVSRVTGETASVPGAAFGVTLVLVTICLLLLLPYFAFVFRFLSPLSIIEKIKDSAYKHVQRARRNPSAVVKRRVMESVDELQDVARSATEQSDRGIAMACVDALKDLVIDYQRLRPELPAAWFTVAGPIADDPDFVSMAPSVLAEVEEQRLWFEVKVFRQYLSLMTHCVPDAREVANLIAINTNRVGVQEGAANRDVLDLCIRCFNSYLRTSINAADNRTSYYVMNQYWGMSEALMREGADASVLEIAAHFKYYGQMAHKRGQSFLLETAAGDLTRLVESSLENAPRLADDLLTIVLDLDLEIRSETQEESLLGVRKAQLQLATLFSLRGDEKRARRICHDLAGERMPRLLRLRKELESEHRPHYWEFTDRGLNFAYLAPDRRARLEEVFRWIQDEALRTH